MDKITMYDVVSQLGIPCDTTRRQVYIPCPVCKKNDRQKKLNINFTKNDVGVFRCAKCGVSGGPVSFWGLFRGISDNKEAAKDYFKEAKKISASEIKAKPVKLPEPVDVPVAPIEIRDNAYRSLIAELTLSNEHMESLKKRGLSEDTIRKNEYRSYPTFGLCKTAKAVQKKHGCTLEGVPGFYMDNGEWSLVKEPSGILIPQRDGRGRIESFQIRFDTVKGDMPRYISLSTRDMEKGSPSHAFVHLSKGEKGLSEVVLTEGALKADVISELSGYSVLAIPGVNSRNLLPKAIASLKANGLKRVLIAFDMDLKTNEHVEAALKNLKKELSGMGICYKTLYWDESEKGLDDYLYSKKSS